MDIVEFLTDRYDEEQQLAKVITKWGVSVVDPYGYLNASIAEFIATNSPARVLADIVAKKRLIDLHKPGGGPPPFTYVYCLTCGSGEPYQYPTDWPCDTLKLLAAPHAEHPDHDPAWAIDS